VDAAVVKECQKLDLVFVVDDSGSMAGAQAKLRATFPSLVSALAASKAKSGASLDYRLAVTTTDTMRTNYANGGAGGFVNAPQTGCDPGGSRRAWLEHSDLNLATAFGCRADVGTSGSATERPIDALMLSLSDRLADQNIGFVRADALLGFVILTDEEDSSTTTPEAAIERLDLLKRGRAQWAGAVISGEKAGTCSTAGHSAGQAPKLHGFVEGATDAATGRSSMIWRTICQPTFDAAVTDAVAAFVGACRAL